MAQERNMAEGTNAGPEVTQPGPQAENAAVKSPIPGMSRQLFATLNQRHPLEVIQQQRYKYETHEDFLKDAEQEAERIRTALAQKANNEKVTGQPESTKVNLPNMPLSPGQVINGKIIVEGTVLENAALGDEERKQKAAEVLGKELSEQQQKELIAAHEKASKEAGLNEEYRAGVYNLKREQIRGKAEELSSFTKEERRKLFEAGLVGRLSPGERSINPDDYGINPMLKQVATRVKHAVDRGLADEDFFNRIAVFVEAQLYEGKIPDAAADKANGLLDEVEILRNRAIELNNPERPSVFTQARIVYEQLMSRPIPKDPIEQQQLKLLQEQSRQRIEQLALEAENHPVKPLKEFFRRVLDSYKKIKETRVRELQGRGREAVIEQERSRARMQEQILEDAAELAPLKAEIGGIYQYLWDGIHALIGFEEEGINRIIKHPAVERIFTIIKRQRAKDRMSTSENRYFQAESYWGGATITIFGWPESARDMILTVMDWMKDRIADIGQRDAGTANQEFEEARKTGPMLLKNSRIRCNDEPGLVALFGKILETNPDYLRARAISEALPDVFANDMIMKAGNTEYGPQAKERFAARFIANFNAMYLENRCAAYLMQRIRRHKDGTYWTGHNWRTDKAEEGDILDYRTEIQEELIDEAATLDFFTESLFGLHRDLFSKEPKQGEEDLRLIRSKDDEEDARLAYKGFFELREFYKLQYSANDPLEILLLDPNDEIRKRIADTKDDEALTRHDLRVKVFRRIKQQLDREDGFDFVTRAEIEQEEKRRRRPLSDEELFDLAEVRKDVFREQLRIRLRNEGKNPDSDESKAWIEKEVEQKTESTRQEAVRTRIREQMELLSNKKRSYFIRPSKNAMAQFDEAKKKGDLTECDRIAWRWVKDYNDKRILTHQRRWYPSGWDKVRLKIDRAAKVIDRSLTDEERVAMYESAYFPEAADGDVEVQARIKDLQAGRIEEARFGFELARSFQGFLMESSLLGGMRIRMIMPKGHPQAGEYTGRLADDETSVLLGLIKGRINPVTREVEVERDANGEAIIVDPERKSLRVWDVIEARLAKAIADEEAEIKPFKDAKRQTQKALYKAELAKDQTAIDTATRALDETTKNLRNKLVDCQFLVTHAFKAKGMVNGRFPTTPHTSALDNSGIKFFGGILAEFGVEVAPGLPFADYKKEIYEFLERERRGLRSETRRANNEFMLGKYPIYERDINGKVVKVQGVPKPAVSLFTMSDDWGEPQEMEDRLRVVDSGDDPENLTVTEAEYNISTSGGVKFPEFIPFAGTNYFPLGIWLGCRSIGDINNYMKRRNEVEAHKQKMLDPRKDMTQNAKAQAAAYKARTALTGGSLGEGQFTPGFLMEPIHGAWQVADVMRSIVAENILHSLGLGYTKTYIILMDEVRSGKRLSNDPDLEVARQLTWVDHNKLASKGKVKSNELYNTTAKVFDYFTMWLKAEKEVEQNRIGNAPRNYVYENTIRWYAFRRLLRESLDKGGRGIVDRLGYSREAFSEISLAMVETMLMDGDYLILRDYERNRLAQEGALILSKVLHERDQDGNIIMDPVLDDKGRPKTDTQGNTIKAPRPDNAAKQKGRSLLNEETWNDPGLHKEVKKALENVRRRGLLEFMREEGFYWYTLNRKTGKYDQEKIRNWGESIPPLVRKEAVAGNTEMFPGIKKGDFRN
ncbi:MAG: hypothetical protein UT04_C0005G0008 [Candidatus Daviesbacteria bacterium GW2011_GWF2_38_7]|nr:MAG: hypothetical protein UT04_C0005G0008 [Candidatus Daviesbacteria bacterium GW2011_GWF2_38_7]